MARVFITVDVRITCPASPARFTVTSVVVIELDTILCAIWITGIGKTLIDISLTPMTNKTRRTDAFVATNLVFASPTIMATVN